MLFPDYVITYEPTDFRSLIIWLGHIKTQGTPKQYDEAEKAANALQTFTTKQEYLDWVAHWKAHYKALVEAQKALKKEIHNPVNHQQVFHNEHGDRWYSIPASGFQSQIAVNKDQLTALIYLRRAGKKKSWKMKQEQK